MPSVSFSVQLKISNELDQLIESNENLQSRSDGIKFLLEERKKYLTS